MARFEPGERSLVLVRPRGSRLPAGWSTETRNGVEVAEWMAIQYDAKAAEDGGEGITGRIRVSPSSLWEDTVPEECAEDVITEWEDTFARDIPAASWEYLVLRGVMMGSMRGRGFRGVPVAPWAVDRPQQRSSSDDSRASAGVGAKRVGRRRGRGNAGTARTAARVSGRPAPTVARARRSRRG